MQIDSICWGCVLSIKPSARIEDIVKCDWINPFDVYIEFTNGEKYIYDTYNTCFRFISYTKETITDEQWKKEFRDKLYNYLKRNGISQEELAKGIGTSQQMISRYISGDAMPGIFMLHKIAKFLGCDDKDLLYEEY